MGVPIDRERFTATEFVRFGERLGEQLASLRALLERPGFGEQEATLGAEVELHLVDDRAQPSAVNAEVLASLADERFTLEINRFNLEANLSPQRLRGTPFSSLLVELREAIALARRAAALHGARPVMVGTLPTLELAHLRDALSDAARYRVLSSTLRDMRGEPFSVRIDGHESLRAHCEDVALEGACASFQVHLRVTPSAFANTFNAAQLAAAPLLAVSANSPFFDGKYLWEETRIPLFEQAVDTRVATDAKLPSRVAFGHGWVRNAWQLFAENVALHPVLLPMCSDDEAARFEELRLHHGTVWNWNRAVFDPDDGGHLRIEHRLLPSGPSALDMAANAAFAIGLSLGLRERMDVVTAIFPFAYAEQNVYRAAQHGLQAELFWPSERAPSPRLRPARELVRELVPVALRGLTDAGVQHDEAAALLAIIDERAENARTGAAVQRVWLGTDHRAQSLRELVERYLDHSFGELPVHRW